MENCQSFARLLLWTCNETLQFFSFTFSSVTYRDSFIYFAFDCIKKVNNYVFSNVRLLFLDFHGLLNCKLLYISRTATLREEA